MRLIRALGSTLLLAALLVGVPALLWHLTAPVDWLTLDWPLLLRSPDDGTLLVVVLGAVGWLAWAALALSTVAELLEQASRGRLRVPLPGLGWLRPAAGALVGAALAGLVTVPTADDPRPHTQVAVVAADPSAHVAEPTSDAPSHVVTEDDDLWSLAEQFYGSGDQWREVARHNPGVDPQQALRPGMVLRFPGALPDQTPTDVPPAPAEQAGAAIITVKSGDTLSGLAAQHLGDGDLWPQIHQANLDQIDDPDLIDIGWRLRVPGAATAAPEAEARLEQPLAPIGRLDPAVDLPSLQPTSPTPTPASAAAQRPTQTQTDQSQTTPTQVGEDDLDSIDPAALATLGISGSVAALVAGAWVLRRRLQQQQRPLGRRLPHPDSGSARFLSAVRTVADRDLDRTPLDPDDSLAADPQRRLLTPATVVVGERDDQQPVLLDLAPADLAEGLCTEIDASADLVHDLIGGMVTSLACADWSAGLRVLVVGPALSWVTSFDHPGLSHHDDLDEVIEAWHQIGEERRRAGAELSPDCLPELLLCAVEPSDEQRHRLVAAQAQGMGLVLPSDNSAPSREQTLPSSRESIEVTSGAARLHQQDLTFVPTLIGEPARRALVELNRATAAPADEPAPWWSSDPPDEIAFLTTRPTIPQPSTDREEDQMATTTVDTGHPVLLVLGPVELLGTRGLAPTKAARQCAEYCAWILQHPGRTASAMQESLLVAEGTRRSNMSRLRTWLGSADEVGPYLPEAYTGRIALAAEVSSDWERLLEHIAAGVNRTHSQGLVDALLLVRGEPFADAAPGQWHWAEQWRSDMVSTIRDVALVLAERSMGSADHDTARWAVRRGLVAAPEDELLTACLIEIEAAGGNRREVDRLVQGLNRRARDNGVDLLPSTIAAVQRAVEGRTRSRA